MMAKWGKIDLTNFDKVGTFMRTFGQEVKTSPEFPDPETTQLRIDLIEEEFQELVSAIRHHDIVGVADALTDILYVTYGAGHSFGIDLDECFNEVQRSNMSKLMPDGSVKYREDGKVLKGPDYFEPNLRKIVLDD